ncbi:16S rRNA (adenine(1518)-N(6)/adenine(1519)-N(6))-dimethyltransferase RsmA [Pleionea litopenaei]|uniref:Ribosomal RNA small subunit methyltransferase A n=1 Tax=Pleionea litopenaei TaxID=3070815 RepID=A0AA51RQK5_9GAMM|nr:16S rRNA (adenine(1518)-N(6)/adenine(1519)-N(6))-dimethyltransferase RsmA [Pleionea sp. HL-JVS1]WMS85709.1 16S rRNA (adenine(1518)-N(6)/adenine(1519)-N(6))-dimethyltransferase RsmA [Pleionea sp. HL-JVS1]
MKPIHHQARKRFGQNFLHDPTVIGRIVATIQPQPGDNMVEIGPGPGALTQPILSQIGSLKVIELDRDVIPKLKMFCLGDGELEVIEADALTVDFAGLSQGTHNLRVIGNLPYNISTPLMFHLFESIDQIKDMHFMLQKEVVERLVAVPGGKDYGRLSIMAQYYAKAELMFIVKPGAFNPPPKVDSAIVRLTPRPAEERANIDVSLMNKVVTSAFSLRRKTLRNSLKAYLSAEDFEHLGIDPKARAETLPPSDFVRITAYLEQKG